MGISNLESRIVKLENTAKTEFGTPVSAIFFPVRKLMLAEERSHNEDGVAFPVLVATWDKPAGVLLPDSIRLIHNDTTVSLPGTATSYRMTGYTVDATVSVKVTAIYAQGNSSTIIAEKTISGDIEPPSVPTNLTVTGGFRTLTLRWENPTAEDFSHVEIWESITDNNIATAERIAQAYGTEFVRSNCAVLETRWYWIRAIDAHGNYSDFTSVASGTTTAIAMEDVPENTISESMLVDTLAQKIDDTDAAIQIVEDVRMGEVNVFRQASAPTTGMITGDLWIDNTEVVHRYEGGEWVSKEGTPVYDLLKTAIAQYVVKTQTVTGDGQLKVAGFGLYNDATTGSEFAILADKFYVYAQKEDGSSYSNIQVFTVDTTTTPPTVGINGNLIVSGSITGDKINAAAKIQLGDGGEFITGANSIVQMASGVIVLDSEGGTMQVRNPSNITTGDFVQINTGDIATYRYLSGAYHPMKSLRKMSVGQNVANNTTVTIPGVFPSAPQISVSPCELQSFHAGYSSQNQTLFLQATNINYNTTTGVCTFVPRAELRIAAGSGGTSGVASGSTSTGTASYRSTPYYDFAFSPSYVDISLSAISLPANVGTINVIGKVYAQAFHNKTTTHPISEGDVYHKYYLVPHPVDFVIYANIGGTNYVVGSGTIPVPGALMQITSEPSSLYVSRSTNITVGNVSPVNMTLWARFTPQPVSALVIGFYTGSDSTAGAPVSVTPYNIAWLGYTPGSYVLPAATTLALGTLNYMAISE